MTLLYPMPPGQSLVTELIGAGGKKVVKRLEAGAQRVGGEIADRDMRPSGAW